MCGIAGALADREAATVARRMVAVLGHRGPDDMGLSCVRQENGAIAGAFAHTRLSILDLSQAGHQPMSTPENRYTITFNGEIYNFRSLRAELVRDGVRFKSESDTEVILHGWARQGPRFLGRLRGMFAFALWDRSNATCYLARDPFGIKPLYYAVTNGAVYFASEVRAILASGRIYRRLSHAAV